VSDESNTVQEFLVQREAAESKGLMLRVVPDANSGGTAFLIINIKGEGVTNTFKRLLKDVATHIEGY
jgi:hypothetical protein